MIIDEADDRGEQLHNANVDRIPRVQLGAYRLQAVQAAGEHGTWIRPGDPDGLVDSAALDEPPHAPRRA